MPIKCTALFQLATNVSDPTATQRRLGGWSESIYSTQNDANFVQILFQNWCQSRAALLPAGAAVVGQRYQKVDPAGISSTSARVYPGTAGTQADIPQMCLNMRAQGVGVRNIRGIQLRGIPDARVVEGEYSPSAAFEAALTALYNRFFDFNFRGRNLDSAQAPIFSIDVNGVYFTTVDNVFQLNNIIRVLRTTDSNKEQVGGRFRVSAVTSTRSGTLFGWNLGNCTGGRMRVEEIIYPGFLSGGISGRIITSKKVGRPFKQYRGRASRRR